ncbi:PAS domain-containing protein [Aliiroseovarius sediminis]|uniref:PAS domain-containing protein n=1 Tax=Aliiroseovarius sediminis TaxID=2925839 RepID=UPI001F57072B|nr:PAS domain-containing protein [Aliiroseovarius sediminis]MCI2394050.1 PAS domain-containing protein [Aliiroseovarius sediminis]
MLQSFDDTKLRETLAGLPFAACMTDPTQPDNPLVFVNDLFCDLTGYTHNQLIGRNCRLLQDDATDPQETARLREAITDGREIATDILNRRADGSTFWNRLSIKPTYDDAGTLQRFTGVLMLIEDHPYETLLENQRQSNTALSELHHRLKNHLSLIHSSVRLQVREDGESDGLVAILNRIQSLQTLYAGMQHDNVAPAELDVVDLFPHLTAIGAAITDLTHAVQFTSDVPTGPIEVDLNTATQLGMMVAELVTNAMQHAFDDSGGNVTLRGRVTKDRIQITVADDGCGNSAAQTDPLGSGLGGKILQQMAKTLSATLSTDTSGPGLAVSLELPLPGGDKG